MGGQHDRRRRHLVDVAHLQADDAVLDVVDDPDAVACSRSRRRARAARRAPAARRRARPARRARTSTVTTSASSGACSGARDELEDVVVGRVRRGPRSSGPPTSGPRGCRRSSTASTSVPPLTGMPCSRAYAISSSRPICQARTGAMTFSSGASVAIVASMRTWSLPLPVQPWAIVSQPVWRAYVDRELGDQRAAERGEQRVAAAVERVGLDRRHDEVARELLARVDDVALDRAELAAPCPRRRRSPRRAGRG